MSSRLFAWTVAVVAAVVPAAGAAEPTYWQDVRPILRKHCTVCHSEKNLKESDVSGGLALDSLESIRKGSKRPIVRPGKATESLFIKVLRHPKADQRMPLDADPLPDETVAVLSRWVDAGLPEGTKPAEAATAVAPAKSRKRSDVVIATKAVLPKGVAKPGQTGPLEIVAPIGPLPPVAAVAYSGDRRYLASGAYGRVVIWDLKAAKPVRVLPNVLGAVNDLKFSPDNSLLAVSGGQPSARGDIRIFNTSDWKLAATLGGHTDVVGCVAFSPDGKSLASASFDKTVRVWNLSTRECVLTFTGHSDFVHAVAFGPTGDWLVTASKDKTGRLIDVKTGQSRFTFSGSDQEVLAIAVKPDGSAVVTAGLDPALSWWNPKTGEHLKRTAGHDVAVHELAFSKAGDIVASAGADKTVRIWNAKSMDAVRTIPVGSVVYAVANSPDGKVVAAGTFDGRVRLFAVVDGRPLATLVALSENEWLAATPEGFAVASDEVAAKGRWKAGTVSLDAGWIRKAVNQPAAIAKAFAGENPGAPTFAGPQP